MSGKAYTMKEMKMIVEYLVENKAYGEIRGRKMWTDFANSKTLNRTWQSLKETFLKRILPDIHNPYYKLSLIQIASFRQGSDMESKLNNKLDVKPVDKDDDTDESGHPEINDIEHNVEDEDQREKEPGEAPKTSDLVADRASTDTLVLDMCYETAEDIQKALEESDKEKNVKEKLSDNEDEEHKETKKNDKLDHNESSKQDEIPIEISDSEASNSKMDKKLNKEGQSSLKIVKDLNNENAVDMEKLNGNPKDTSNSILGESGKTVAEQKIETNRESTGTQNFTNTTVDTQLPNNPEEHVKNCLKDSTKKSKVQKLSLNNNKNQNKKRSMSQEPPNIKRKKMGHQLSISDTDAITNVTKNGKDIGVHIKINNLEKEDQTTSHDAQILNLDPISESDKAESRETKQNLNNSSEVKINNETSEIEKSCEKNVALNATQSSYTISGNSTVQNNTSKQQKRTVNIQEAQTSKTRHVVQLDLNSSDDEVSHKNKSVLHIIEKKRRTKALAHTLGFTNDVSTGRKRRRSYIDRKQSSLRHKLINISSDTSDYTSDTESEFISPPRSRPNRNTRKYVKPKSAHVYSLDEEGGLFVIHGKKIYPVVKDGKILKHYLTYTSDDESQQEPSIWKLKYVEAKKKAIELAKLLKEATDSNKAIEDAAAVGNTDSYHHPESTKKNEDAVADKQPVATTSEANMADIKQDKIVKVKFTMNNEEVQLEAHWKHINPVLEQIVHMFNKNKKTEDSTEKLASKSKISTVQQESRPAEAVVSGVSTPVVKNDETNRVNEIESKIFKEIEEIDNAESRETYVKLAEDSTKRSGNQRGASAETSANRPKRIKLSNKSEKQTDNQTDTTTVTTRRSGRTPKIELNENTIKNQTNISRKSTSRRAKGAEQSDSDDNVRYKFPSPPPNVTRRKRGNKGKAEPRNNYAIKPARTYSSPENPSLISEETQGYVDSDSPVICVRRKRRCSLSTRTQPRCICKQSITCLNDDITSESSNSNVNAPLKSTIFTNSNVSSHIYRSESYQLLCPTTENLPKHLETNYESNTKYHNSFQLEPIDEYTRNNNNDTCKNFNELNDIIENESSSISLPTSPVFSIVENISVDKSLLASIDEHSIHVAENSNAKITINELKPPANLSDVSMPLLQRYHIVEKQGEDGTEHHYTINPQNPSVSESFLNKVCTVKLEDLTLSDSINAKLRNMLIESGKKCGKQRETNRAHGIKTVPDNIEPKVTKKSTESSKLNTKKRSSTPRKRKIVRQSKAPNCEPFIEEEHTELCSHTGRKSCQTNMFEEFNKEQVDTAESNSRAAIVNTKREKKKKDVIKVKILRPPKRTTNIGYEEMPQNDKKTSNDTTTNEAESGIFLGINDSVDLIHNHSETCLQAHECILDNSLKIVQNSDSIISINSSIHSEKNIIKTDDQIALELMGSNAQDACDFFKDVDSRLLSKSENAPTIVTPNSLITEDLSVEITPRRPSKWHFFSEEDTETNNLESPESAERNAGYGANLDQIFPITCVVPNLSTITEMSKDTDDNTNSQKIIDDNIRSEFYSQSLFSNQ